MEVIESKPKTFKEIEDQIEEDLHQFTFVTFISNPTTRMVQIYIDGEISNFIERDKFVKIIRDICGYEEATKVELACMEYGVPYLYDRENKSIKQLRSIAEGRNMDLSKKRALSDIQEERALLEPTHNQIFNNMKSIYNKIMNIGFPK